MKRNTMVVDFETVVPTRFKFERGSEKSEEVARKIKEFYYGNEEVAVDNKDIYYRVSHKCQIYYQFLMFFFPF